MHTQWAAEAAELMEEWSMYRVGYPGWKLAAKFRIPMKFLVHVHKDEESGTYWAESDDLDGLAVAGDTLDDVHKAVFEAANALLDEELNGKHARAQAEVLFSTALPCAA
jgi:predicted RNase H-like HicB family nuclease